jgi:hypothetical protein
VTWRIGAVADQVREMRTPMPAGQTAGVRALRNQLPRSVGPPVPASARGDHPSGFAHAVSVAADDGARHRRDDWDRVIEQRGGGTVSERVADVLWSMLVGAGVKRCYGIVGDALNPVIDGLRRNGQVEFIHVRNEEAGAFAAVAEACLTGTPVAVCGTAGPGVMHLLTGLVDAQREGAPVIAIAGDTASGVIDTGAVEEVNPYATFQVASLYTGRIVNPAQTRAVVQTAIRTALSERGPTVIAIPGDVAASEAPEDNYRAVVHNPPLLRPSDSDLRALAGLIDAAGSITIFGGDGCRDAHDEVVALAERLRAPVGYAFRGKQWLEWGNPNAVGMSGLLGWGGAYDAMHDCELLILLGTDFRSLTSIRASPRRSRSTDAPPPSDGVRTWTSVWWATSETPSPRCCRLSHRSRTPIISTARSGRPRGGASG